MVTIRVSKEIPAPLDKVWEIVSDIDNESEYWHGTKSIKNISKKGNIIEREIIIAFKNSKCLETVTLHPKKSINVQITKGPIHGTKTILLNGSDRKTKLDVLWDITLAGLLGMFTFTIKKHITEGTEEALDRISKAT